MRIAVLSRLCAWSALADLLTTVQAPRTRHGRSARWPVVWVMLLAWAAGPVVAADAPVRERGVVEWLLRMHEASRQRAYMGTLVVSSGSAMSSSRIWHVCDGKQQMERVDTLTGEPRTTIRRNSEVITFVPSSRLALVEKRESLGVFPELLRTPSHQIATFYDAAEKGTERVAGHLADVVTITPRDGLRFGYRIWSEQKTGLVVKMQTLGEQGAVLEQVAFTELQLDAPVRMDQLKQQMGDTKGYDVQRTVLQKTTPQAEGWQLKDAVPGFTTMSCHTRGTAAGGRAPVQWVLSDGLATVSLFIEPFDAARHQKEASAVMGATHSLTQRLGDYWLTAMGEVPWITLKRFVAGLERVR